MVDKVWLILLAALFADATAAQEQHFKPDYYAGEFAEALPPPTPGGSEAQRSPPGERTAEQKRGAEQRGTEDHPAIVKILPTEKTAEERSQEKQERSEKSSADWWMIRLTGAVVTVSVSP